MKHFTFLLLAIVGLAGNAQQNAGSEMIQLEAQRTRIAGERNRAQLTFDEHETRCYQRFAVNDCLREARNLRRDVLADLRRQELSLSSAEAKRKGAESLRRLEERSSLVEQQQEAARQKASQGQAKER